MKLIKREADPEPAPQVEPGPHLFQDEGLLARWFLTYRLEEELERARRYDRPLAAVIVSPQLIMGERLKPQVRAAAAAAATRTGRRCDIVGWLDAERVIIIMPETNDPESEAAASRIRIEMWRGSVGVGGQKWTVTELGDLRSYATAEELLAEFTYAVDSKAA